MSATPAASVIVLRRGAGDRAVEALLLRRSAESGFLAGAFVFPGGKVDAADAEAPIDAEPAALARFAAFSAIAARAVFAAAVRELAEEAHLAIPARALAPFSHWRTPSSAPKRFDTCFFLAAMPDGQEARHDGRETVERLWLAPLSALARHDAGALELPPPTQRLLLDLTTVASVGDALALAASRPIVPIQPRIVPGDPLRLLMPHDPAYAGAPGEGDAIEAGHPLAAGPSRYVLREGRWRSDG